jgi:hypothetical protein
MGVRVGVRGCCSGCMGVGVYVSVGAGVGGVGWWGGGCGCVDVGAGGGGHEGVGVGVGVSMGVGWGSRKLVVSLRPLHGNGKPVSTHVTQVSLPCGLIICLGHRHRTNA